MSSKQGPRKAGMCESARDAAGHRYDTGRANKTNKGVAA
jgi:hypothetical protein